MQKDPVDRGRCRFVRRGAEKFSAMDVVFDTVGGDTLQRSWGVLTPGGRMITIAADSEVTTDDRVKQAYFFLEANPEELTQIGKLLESGSLKTVVDVVLPPLERLPRTLRK